MNKTTTVILSIVFLLLIGTLIALYTGLWQPAFLTNKSSMLIPVFTQNNQNASATPKNLIKRGAVQTYEAAIKEGNDSLEKGYFMDALESYLQASQFEPAKLEPYQKLGESYFYLDNTDKAQENFEYVLNKQPGDEAAGVFLGKTYLKKSNFDSAMEIFLSLNPENQEVRYYIGLLRLVKGDLEKGLNNLQTAVSVNSASPIGQKAQNMIHNIDEFNLFLDGKNIHLQTLIGRGFVQNNEFQLAITQLKNVLKENKQYRDAWILLGFSYYSVQKYDLAVETLNNAYDLDPEKAETQYFLGLAHLKMGNNEKASTYLTLAIKNGFEPKLEVQKKIADLYLTSQNFEEALATYLEIIKENQANDINLYVRPIWIYIEVKKEPIQALELAKQAQTHFPQNAMGFNLLGWAYLANDDLAQAQEYLEKSQQLDPNLQAVYLNLGDLYLKQGDKEKAKDFYQRTYFLDKNSSIGNLAATKYNALLAN